MIYYKTAEEIELIRQSCRLVCETLAHVASLIRPGVTGMALDAAAEEFIRSHHALPAFKGYRNFPASLCISVNEGVVHGIPTTTEFKDGDILSIDCGVKMNGYCGDAAYTFALGEVAESTMQLLRATEMSLYKGIEQAIIGKRIGDIGFAIQEYIRQSGYSIVRELVGHGLGKDMHEEPEVPNIGKKGQGIVLREGLVIAIEPMIILGRKEVVQAKDGWTIYAKDRTPAAHYEHTIAITKKGADILSDHSAIEQAIIHNTHLKPIRISTAIAV